MLSLIVLLFQMMIPVVIGFMVNHYLHDVVYRLLVELCGTEDRAEFWLRATAVLTIGAPMMLVFLFGHSISDQSCSNLVKFADIIQRTIALSLGGALLAVAFVSRVIWKQSLGGVKVNRSAKASA